MENIRVISSEIDGRALRQEKNTNKYFIRCSGNNDEQQINEAIRAKEGKQWQGLGDAWLRIFGR